ncbi:KH domain-containing protein [Patescibacteria group bacterium]|nr:KH domain-containing protein [Patescibacteria group bacterium]MBU1246701.1 KH domain-containing protein [Patescibacteria group bacterium]MBU1519161.1 KH domain-containing protein [Patescibacteria group bacterium]MBU1730273.1 KH domain-containing protein [Patescibacteria group bacterium]MBU1956646.1 KH domain-containing protein [Patescibacteria group bacterium]
MTKERDEQFLELVITSLVDNPDSVKITRTVDEMGVLLSLDIHPDDMGKIIGRAGNTAKAIRTLLRVVGLRNNARINLKINEPEGSTRLKPATSFKESSVPPVSAPISTPVSDTSVSDSVDQAMEDLKI